MITISETARSKFRELIAGKGEDGYAVRIGIASRGPSDFQYDLRLVKGMEKSDDILVEMDGLKVYVDSGSADNLKGAAIDFIPAAGGFKIDNPNPVFAWDDPLAQAVQDVISNAINPGVAQHGGWVTLLDVKDNVAYIQLGGGCVGCGMVDVTLKQGIEVMIKETVPQIQAVVDTTDHANGTNPYYAAAKGGGFHQPAKGGEAPRSPLA